MLYRIFLSLALIYGTIFAASKEVLDIKSHYKSLARDFLIYEHIKKPDTPLDDIVALKDDVYRMKGKIKDIFDEKLSSLEDRCKSLDEEEYLQNCVVNYPTLEQAEKLSKKELKERYFALLKDKKIDKKDILWIKAMSNKDIFKSLSRIDAKAFLKVFFEADDEYIDKNLDKKLSYKFLDRLVKEDEFDKFVRLIAMNKQYKKLSKSILRVYTKNRYLNFSSAFYLGIIALQNKKDKKSVLFFRRAYKLSKTKTQRDKAIFWKYLVTKNKSYLKRLARSTNLDFYSLYAREKLHKRGFKITKLKPSKKNRHFDTTDPFLWAKTKDKIDHLSYKKAKKFARKLYTKETLAQYTFLMERAGGYSKYFFLMPFEKYLKNIDKKRKALIYSLARQESRFVPASVSISYALGPMQFMPFLAKLTAEKLKMDEFEYFDIFKPQIAIKFANDHLDYLQSYLHNPLFISYAYNGGIGFTKALLTKKGLFKKGKYEPFLSMELVHYEQSREYGKKVLTNYIIYARMLGIKTDLFKILKNLTNPKVSDKFRATNAK